MAVALLLMWLIVLTALPLAVTKCSRAGRRSRGPDYGTTPLERCAQDAAPVLTVRRTCCR